MACKEKKKSLDQAKRVRKDAEKGIFLDFGHCYCWESVGDNRFTNYYKDVSNFINVHKSIFKEIVTELKQYDDINSLMSKKKHCHEISNDKLGLVEKIIKEQIKQEGIEKNSNLTDKNISDAYNQDINEEKLYQISGTQGIRLIGYFRGNHFNVLIIDHLHLICPDKNYNEKDFSKYNYKI